MQARELRVGVVPMETRFDVIERSVSRAEELGFHSFGLAEGWGLEAFSVLGRLSGCTTTIGLGTGVASVWSRSPAVLAMGATTLQRLTSGRFSLGVGTSTPNLVEGLHDMAWSGPAEKMRAVLTQLRALLEGERIPLSSGTDGLRLAVVPEQKVPLEIGAMSAPTVRLAGQYGDVWVPWLWPRSRIHQGSELLEEGAQEARRTAPAIMPAVPLAVASDEAGARRIAARWLRVYLTRMGPVYPRMLRERFEMASSVDSFLAHPADDLPPGAFELVDELMVFGSYDRAAEDISRWFEAGIDGLAITLPPGHPGEELEEMLAATSPSPLQPDGTATTTSPP